MATQSPYELRQGESLPSYYARNPGSQVGSATTGQFRPGLDAPSVTPPPSTTPVPRYDTPSTPPARGFVDSETASLFGPGGIYADRNAPDQATIRENVAKQAQAQIEAVNKAADALVAQERNVNAPSREGQARALASRGGLLGSTFYESGTKGNLQDKNREVLAQIENERLAKVSNILWQTEVQSQKEYDAKLAAAKGNADAYVNFLKESQANTRQGIKDLASAGVSFDVLSTDPQYKDTLANLLKYGNFASTKELQTYMAAQPKNVSVEGFNTKVEGGKVINSWIDKATGKVHTDITDLPAEDKGFTKSQYDSETGNIVLWDEKGNSKVIKATGGKGSTDKPTTLSADQIRKLAVAGVPQDVASGIFKDLTAGFTLEDIRKNLANSLGQERGYSYLDNFMTTMKKEDAMSALLNRLQVSTGQ